MLSFTLGNAINQLVKKFKTKTLQKLEI